MQQIRESLEPDQLDAMRKHFQREDALFKPQMVEHGRMSAAAALRVEGDTGSRAERRLAAALARQGG